MKEDISDPRKVAAKADKIWQSSSARSVNALSTTSPVSFGSDDSVNTHQQRPQPRPASCVAPRLYVLRPPVQPPISAGIMSKRGDQA